MVLNICLKFHENISNGLNVTERTGVCGRNGNFQCSKGNNSERMQSSQTVFELRSEQGFVTDRLRMPMTKTKTICLSFVRGGDIISSRRLVRNPTIQPLACTV